jgi:hypothetical protein
VLNLVLRSAACVYHNAIQSSCAFACEACALACWYGFDTVHHDGFFSSLHAFIKVADNIKDGRERLALLKTGLESCKELLKCKRAQVRQLWLETQE